MVRENERGITLIALVISIIILLILAGITIVAISGENGIIQRAVEAREETEEAEKIQQNTLNSYEDTINEYMGIDWDMVLANAEKHPDQKTSTAIGVGTDGRAVNMDLWKYTLLEDGTYALNSEETITAIKENNWAMVTMGYTGSFTESGEIEGVLPQYIKDETDGNFIPVTDLSCLFARNTEIKVMPKIPSTIKTMNNTFLNCENLIEVSSIPFGVTDLQSTFSRCTSLTQMPNIADTVTNMNSTFYLCSNLSGISRLPKSLETMEFTFQGCSKLTEVPKIPDGVLSLKGTFMNCIGIKSSTVIPNSVTSMRGTFSGCSNLITAPEIPESVENLQNTFQDCSSLTGTITINAKINGTILDNSYNDYYAVLWNAATNPGCEIKLTGICPVLQDIVTTTNRDNITLLS